MPSPKDTLLASLGEEPAGRPIPENPGALLFTAEAAFLLGLSTRTLEALRLKGEGPPFYALGKRAVRYRRCDLDSWMGAKRRRSTSDPGASSEGGSDAA